jgi:hypothetical protein
MKTADSGRVLRPVTMEVGTGDSVGSCELETARKNAVFLCPEGYGVSVGSDELAVVGAVGG